MRSVDQKETFSPLGKAIPAPAPPAPAPAVDGKFIRHPDGTVGTNIPKPPAPPYTLQGMWGRDQRANPSLKWVGEAADAWRGIHAQQAADMAVIREIDMGRKACRD